MSARPPSTLGLSAEVMAAIGRLDTCTASNAVETFGVRLRNEGFVHNTVKCRFPAQPPLLGYAVPGRIRTSHPPMQGGWYYDHPDWWKYVQTIPEPRVIVIEDMDSEAGAGAWFGEVHASIARALGCVGYVTNGAVRDLDAVAKLGFALFSTSVAVSHSYAHVIDFGSPVEIGRLMINPGDLLHGDQHGVHTIPLSIAPDLPSVAANLQQREQELISFCASPDFSVEALASKIEKLNLYNERTRSGGADKH